MTDEDILKWFMDNGGQITLSLFEYNGKMMVGFKGKIRKSESVQGMCRLDNVTPGLIASIAGKIHFAPEDKDNEIK